MSRSTQLAASSRDGHLALRRVERQQALIETISVDATVSGADLMVDGRRVGHVRPDTRFNALDGHLFSTDPNPMVDDQRFYIDDIEFRD